MLATFRALDVTLASRVVQVPRRFVDIVRTAIEEDRHGEWATEGTVSVLL